MGTFVYPTLMQIDMTPVITPIYTALTSIAQITTPLFGVSAFLVLLAIIVRPGVASWAQENRGWLFPAVGAYVAITVLPQILAWLILIAPAPTFTP